MNDKGFTVVEALAVVVLIGLLAVIIVSKIKPSIYDSKEASSLSSANSLIIRMEEYYFFKKMNGLFVECYYDFNNDVNTCEDFSFSGTKPNGGIININANGVISGSVLFGDYNYDIVNNKVISS